jgi:hypothetical protein
MTARHARINENELAVVEFENILNLLNLGYCKAPAGLGCTNCNKRGHLWLKVKRRNGREVEVHFCNSCRQQKFYNTN